MQAGEERRKHIRVFFPGGKVRLLSGQLLALLGKTVDISLGGIRFTSEMDFTVGEQITLEILISDGMKFRANAKIVHFEVEGIQNICGACFVDVDKASEAELGKFIMKLKADQDKLFKTGGL